MQSSPDIVDRLCGLSISDRLSPEPEVEIEAPMKDWFLYLMMDKHISRLNIDEFCKRSSEKPELELLYDYDGDSTKLPFDMEHTRVGSKVHMVNCNYNYGDEFYDSDEEEFEDGMGYCFDPTDPDGPSIRQCDHCNDDDLLHEAAFTLEDKFYSFYPFKVFDPLHQLWKRLLPDPPYFKEVSALGHKLVFSTGKQSCMFDTREEKWEDWPKRNKEIKKFVDGKYLFDHDDILTTDWTTDRMQAAVEHEGFLIAHVGYRLAAFRWDSNGIPKLYRVLNELNGVFHTELHIKGNAMGKCDGGRMWLVYVGYDLMHFWHTCIGVFRVSISNDLDGNPVLSAQVEAAELLFSSEESERIKSAFALCHQPNQYENKIRVIRHPSQRTVAS